MSTRSMAHAGLGVSSGAHLAATGVAGFYALGGRSAGLDVFIASSAPGRLLLTRPDIVGNTFQKTLRDAVRTALASLYELNPDLRAALSGEPADVLYLLRGGLNFGTHTAVEEISRQPSRVHFLSVSRELTGTEIRITDDAYRRIDGISSGRCLVVADIAATGTTIGHAIDLVIEETARRPPRRPTSPVWQLVFVLVATAESLPAIGAAVRRLRAAVAATRGVRATVVALEGLFRLHNPADGAGAGGIGTDFVRRGGVMSPEYLQASLESPPSLFERCVIYDGGQRGFSPAEHLVAAEEYWTGRHREMSGAAPAEYDRLLASSDSPIGPGLIERYAAPWALLPTEIVAPVAGAMNAFSAATERSTLMPAFETRLARLRDARDPVKEDHP